VHLSSFGSGSSLGSGLGLGLGFGFGFGLGLNFGLGLDFGSGFGLGSVRPPLQLRRESVAVVWPRLPFVVVAVAVVVVADSKSC